MMKFLENWKLWNQGYCHPHCLLQKNALWKNQLNGTKCNLTLHPYLRQFAFSWRHWRAKWITFLTYLIQICNLLCIFEIFYDARSSLTISPECQLLNVFPKAVSHCKLERKFGCQHGCAHHRWLWNTFFPVCLQRRGYSSIALISICCLVQPVRLSRDMGGSGKVKCHHHF